MATAKAPSLVSTLRSIDPSPFENFVKEFACAQALFGTRIVPEVHLDMEFADAFSILTAIQWACSNPDFQGDVRIRVETFARRLQEKICIFPNLKRVAEEGWVMAAAEAKSGRRP